MRRSVNSRLICCPGTPAFQPPEIAQGQDRFHGFKVDVWASGITLFRFVTGFYPFEGENVYILYENISKAVLQVPDDLDELLQSLLKGLLERDVKQRLSIAEAKNHQWVRRTYPKYGNDEVRGNEQIAQHTSVLPYVQSLHDPELLDEEEYECGDSPETNLRKEFWRYTKLNVNNQPMRYSASGESTNDGCSFIRAELSQSKRSIYNNLRDKCNQS